MKTIAIVQMLLSLRITYSQEECLQERKTWYYIYNATVEVKADYCIVFNSTSVIYCQMNTVPVRNPPFASVAECSSRHILVGGKKSQMFSKVFCQYTATVNLVEDASVIRLMGNKTCDYNKESCFDERVKSHVVWKKENIVEQISEIYKDNFNVWSLPRTHRRYIKNNFHSLLLTEQVNFCGFNVWKTDKIGIIATETELKSAKKTLLSNLYSVEPKECNILKKDDVTKWYVYKYPVQHVTVNYCSKNNEESQCSGKNETVPTDYSNITEVCLRTFCYSLSCKEMLYKHMVCWENIKLDFENDTLEGLPRECKFSDGKCDISKAFWSRFEKCAVLRNMSTAFQIDYNGAIHSIRTSDGETLLLRRRKMLCGEYVWFGDREGYVASTTILRPTSLSKEINGSSKSGSIEMLFDENKRDIQQLQDLLRYVEVVIGVFVAYYLFNVLVNLLTLRKVNKTRSLRDQVSLMNCVSQSLTTRRLCFARSDDEEMDTACSVPTAQLSELVENDLYTSTSVMAKR